MALKELELLTREVQELTKKLRGESRPDARLHLYVDIQKLLARIFNGAHG